MEQNRIRQTGRVFLFLIFLSISTKHFINYLDYTSNLSSSNIILYTIEDKIIKNGGRGRSYAMIIRHGTNISQLSITSKEFVLIDEGELPVLYMTKGTGKIFSQSIIKRNIRISILFFIFSIVMLFIPWK